MIRTYTLQHFINKEKQEKIFSVIRAYRKACKIIANTQWESFFTGEGFNKMINTKFVKSELSERYKRNCCYQVDGMLKSFISNRQNDFVKMVYASELDETTIKHLLQINRRQLWFKNDDMFSDEELFLAKKIFKHILSKHRTPSYKHINALLNTNVAEISKGTDGEFDYWIKLSTLEKGEPIMLPLKTNNYFDNIKGEIQKVVQVNIKEGEIVISLMKDVPPKPYIAKKEKISIDTGLKELFTVNDGSFFGRNFIGRLKYFDAIISELQANLQRQGIKPKTSKRFNQLVNTIRSFLKNEVRRLLNRIVKIYAPKHIVIERLDFRGMKLSKWLNRLLCKFGKSIIIQKLESLKEEYGINYEEINPAYTSQECNDCGYVSKENRKTQDKFKCVSCGHVVNADVSGSRNILARSSDKEITIYTKKEKILQLLMRRFLERHSRHNSLANGLLPFSVQAQPKQFSLVQ